MRSRAVRCMVCLVQRACAGHCLLTLAGGRQQLPGVPKSVRLYQGAPDFCLLRERSRACVFARVCLWLSVRSAGRGRGGCCMAHWRCWRARACWRSWMRDGTKERAGKNNMAAKRKGDATDEVQGCMLPVVQMCNVWCTERGNKEVERGCWRRRARARSPP